MKPIIIVTGACGYIGSHTLIELIRDGRFEPVSIDSLINSSIDTLERVEKVTGVKVTHFTVDLCDYEATCEAIASLLNVTGIIHFAALKSVPESVDKPLLYYGNNINSLVTVMKACAKFSIKNLIFSSSCSVYGNISSLPVGEETLFNKAVSPYAFTKQIGEQMLEDFVRNEKLKVAALRYFNPVGADKSGLIGEDPVNPPSALVPIVTQAASGLRSGLVVHGSDYNTRDGSCIRDYIHVSDIADAHIKALDYLIRNEKSATFEVFNLGTGNGVTVFEVLKAFEDATRKNVPYTIGPRREGDVEAIFSDSAKANRLLGWVPKFGIEEMMRTAWEWQLRVNEGL